MIDVRTHRRWRLAYAGCRWLAILSLFWMAGCVGHTVTKAQADRIKLGFTAVEVNDILGAGKAIDAAETERLVKSALEASSEQPGGTAPPKISVNYSELSGMRWGSEKKSITVIFRNDRVFRVFTNGLQ